MAGLDYALEREVTVRALRQTVFRFFTEDEPFARWWGPGSRVVARRGGAVEIRYPNGVVARGVVVAVHAPRAISFTYGYEGEGKPVPPGGSLVTVTLGEGESGTRVHLCHALADGGARDAHEPGWRYQLAVLANVAAAEQHRGAERLVDRFLALWSEPDAAVRQRELAAVALPDVEFRDAFAATVGAADLAAHLDAAQRFMPGIRLERRGAVRQCQGTAVAEWAALGPDGAERARGCNVFDLAPDGRIARAAGLHS